MVRWSRKISPMDSAHLCRIFFSIKMPPGLFFFYFSHPVDEQVVFLEISSTLSCPLLFVFIIFFFFVISLFNVPYFPPNILTCTFFQRVSKYPHPSALFCFPFDPWYLLQCFFRDHYFELYPLLVYFLVSS